MPMVNVIRGETLPTAVLNVRTPVVRIPLWAVICWSAVKGLAKLVAVLLRYWFITAPTALLGWLYLRYGWAGPVTLLASVTLLWFGWWFLRPADFRRFGWWPVLGRWRRFVYRRRWLPAMATAGLLVTFDRHQVAPILRRVRHVAGRDVLTVRMVSGQIPDDFAKVSERLTHTFGARTCRVMPGKRPDLVVLSFLRGDPLAALVAPLPVPAIPDFTALPLGLREDGEPYTLRLFGTQLLMVGATGAGKGSVIWSLLRSLSAGIASGLVHVWAFDPKGGMELGLGAGLFARFACDDYEAMADMLDEALKVAQARASRLRGRVRQHLPTMDEPLILLVVDELAALTAYLTDRRLKDRIKASLGALLSRGRSVGVHVAAAIQDPRKEVLPFRDLFPTRIGLRLVEEAHVDLVLGEGARDRGALCDRIPETSQGVGYVVLDHDPAPVRVRFSYLDDDAVRSLDSTYGAGRQVIDGDWTEEGGQAA